MRARAGAPPRPAAGCAVLENPLSRRRRSADAAASLRDSLVRALLHFAAGPPSVRNALCLALAALAAHLPGPAWPAGGALPALAQRLASEPPERAVPCLLELLTGARWLSSLAPSDQSR